MASKTQSQEDFWREYERNCGETVLARALGRYVSGWAEFEEPLWGLVIATSGGFRFHHFPQENWLSLFARNARGGDAPKEQTLFIPRERITAAEFRKEPSLVRRLLFAPFPRLIIRYRKGLEEADLVIEADKQAEAVAEKLRP